MADEGGIETSTAERSSQGHPSDQAECVVPAWHRGGVGKSVRMMGGGGGTPSTCMDFFRSSIPALWMAGSGFEMSVSTERPCGV